MENSQTEVSYDAPFAPRLSRLFIFRFLWVYIEMWVIWVWAIWMGIIIFLHFWYMLILGKRSETLWRKQLRFMRHMSKWQGYLNNLVDKRPKLIED